MHVSHVKEFVLGFFLLIEIHTWLVGFIEPEAGVFAVLGLFRKFSLALLCLLLHLERLGINLESSLLDRPKSRISLGIIHRLHHLLLIARISE